MNKLFLQDLTHGTYGRKVAYTNVEEITEDNILSVLQRGISVFNWNKPIIKYLKDYVKGDCPARYRTKTVRDDIVNHVIENHAWEIVQFKNGQTNAEPIQYISVSKDEKISEYVEKLNTYARVSHKHRKDIDSGEWTSAVGFGYKAVQRTNNPQMPFRIVAPSPMNTFVIYSSITEEPMLAVQELKDETDKRYWLCYDEKYEYRVQSGSLLTLDNVNGVEIKRRLHMFSGIPIVEYPNNADRMSDVEIVIDLLDAINNMQSNRMDAVEQFVQSWVKFINCDIDPETFNDMKEQGALMVKSTKDKQADVQIMTQELNQTESQVAKEDLWDNVLSILAIPNKEGGNKSGDSQGAVELRAGWDFAKTRAKIKDQYIIDAEMRLANVMLGLIHRALGENECPITEFDFTTQIIHNPTDNLVARTDALTKLITTGVHPKLAFETVGLWSDTEKAYQMSIETLDKKQYNEAETKEVVEVEETKVEE